MNWGIRWVCVLFLACITVCACSAFDLDVVGNITYGLPENDESALSIAQDDEGNLAIAGISRVLTPEVNDALFLRIGDAEVFQERIIQRSGFGSEFDVILAHNGDMVIAGTGADRMGEHPLTTDVWVAAIDPEGNAVMNATFGDHGTNESACCIIRTSDGGYLIAGYAERPGTGKTDGLVVKIDASATEEWRRTFGGEQDDMVNSAFEEANGDIIVAGSTESFGNGEADGWVVRMTASGQEIWSRAYGGVKDDAARDLTRASDGILAFAGTTTYITGTDRTDTDAWLVTFDSAGEPLMDMTYGGAEMNASAESVVRTPDGGYLLAGSIEGYGTGDLDAWLMKVDAMGNTVWEERFGGIYDDIAHALIVLSESYYAFCGSFGSGAAGQGQVSDAWVVWLSEPSLATPSTEVIDASTPAEPGSTEEDLNDDDWYEGDSGTDENAPDDAQGDRVFGGEPGDDSEGDDTEEDEDDDEDDRRGDDTEEDEDDDEDDRRGDDTEEDEDDDDDRRDDDSEEDEDDDDRRDDDSEEDDDEEEDDREDDDERGRGRWWRD